MKIIIIIVLTLSLVSCSKEYDISKVESPEDLAALLVEMKKDKVKIDSSYINQIEGQGMHYKGISVSNMTFTENSLTITTDSSNYSAKKLLEELEKESGLGFLSENEYLSDFSFSWDNEKKNMNLEMNLVDGKNLARMGAKDYAKLEINYPKQYDIPLANLHQKLTTFNNAPEYELHISRQNCIYYEVFLDGVNLGNGSYNDTQDFNLNLFLLNSGKHEINIKAIPNVNNSAEPSYIKLLVINKEDEGNIIAQKDFTFKNNQEQSLNLTFNCNIPYDLIGWKNGKDLRKDTLLKKKISTVYEKVGRAILNKDEQAISDLFYLSDFETRQSTYDTSYTISLEYWEFWLKTFDNTYKYSVAQDFNIEYNEDGRLIYVFPKEKSDMLVVTGKNFSRSFDFFLYQPKNSNELKIIR